MDSCRDTPKGWVAPFGYPRINACSRLPVAFRSVPRPSSPPGAKASTECPSHAREHRTSLAEGSNHHVQEPSTPMRRDLRRISQCGGTRTTMLELSLHTTNHWPSQPTIRQNASEHMCRRSLGCIPGVAPKDLGRSDFAIPLPGLRQRGEVGTRSRGSPTNGAPRDAPEPDSQCQKNRCQAPLPSREEPDTISQHPNPSDRR